MYLPYLAIVVFGFLVTTSTAIFDSRVVNATLAVNYQFPWQVSLTVNVLNTTALRYCGGSLIAPNFVLTAATCVLNAHNIKADVGSIFFSNPLQTQNTSAYVIHPQFNTSFNVNNIAIILLHQEIWYTNDKRAIYLAGRSQLNSTFINIGSYLSGFGVWQNGINYMSENLRFAHVTAISNDDCRHNFIPDYIRNETMCTMGYGNTLQSGCYGDTGGAVVTNVNGIWIQIGLISTIHGGGCTGTFPNLHTKIAPYAQWIFEMTGIPVNP